ncbi:MAG: hypothetical protein ABEJ26_14390 [Halosimplex sp.]
MDDRGTSVVVNYVTAIGVIAILVVSLFVGLGGFVENQQERAVRSELDVVGNRVAVDLGVADRLARSATGSDGVTVRTELPERAAGTRYRIELSREGSGLYAVTLRASDPEVTVEVGVRLRTAVTETTVSGGDLRLRYESGSVVVTNA